jgi:hypothetical protein
MVWLQAPVLPLILCIFGMMFVANHAWSWKSTASSMINSGR